MEVKIVIVGDSTVGKTSYLRTWMSKSYPGELDTPTIEHTYVKDAIVNRKLVSAKLFDTGEYITVDIGCIIDHFDFSLSFFLLN